MAIYQPQYVQVWHPRHVLFLSVLFVVVLIIFRQMELFERALATYFMTEMDCQSHAQPSMRAEVCGYFKWEHFEAPRMFHKFLRLIPVVVAVAALIWLVKLWRSNTSFAVPLLGVVSFLAGPLLVVNGLLKSFWGRPRPYQTIDAGRDADYVLPGTISDQCSTNCSFVSGDVAAAFWLFWLLPFLPAKWRTTGFWFITVYAITMGFFRIAMGRHYLSDVVLGAMLSLIVVAAVDVIISYRLRTTGQLSQPK